MAQAKARFCSSVAGAIATIAYWLRDFNWPPAPISLRKYVTTDPKEMNGNATPANRKDGPSPNGKA